jgi:cytochrome c553
MVLGLGWSKGLSTRFSRAGGTVELDLARGLVRVELHRDGSQDLSDVWIVDNRPGPARSVRPEPGDVMLPIARLPRSGDEARLETVVHTSVLSQVEVDLVVVTPRGRRPDEETVLVGVPSLFQRLAARVQRDPRMGVSPLGSVAPPLSFFEPARVLASTTAPADLHKHITAGRTLFFEETFAGNGRTCGTCHPAENNFTIDPDFIATLSSDDPLFVAEFVPELQSNFENPKLMRELGLILENADGFDDLVNKFTMRGVPHTLALTTSLRPAPSGADGTTIPPQQRTGWSGDGAPGSGTLREFAIGAVTQHFPRTLHRVPGTDFRLPTDEELDALEAFQLSLGRSEDPDLASLSLKDPVARRGVEIFLTADSENGTVAAGKCNVCHANGGAALAALPGGFNFNFDTGVEALADHPADHIDPGRRPPDGGFGAEPHPSLPGAFGNGTFNTPPLVEAADTAPFFHNSAVQTLEESVAFYNSEAFRDSPAGQFLAASDSGGIAIQLAPTQVEAVARFLRVLNVLENIRSGIELLKSGATPFDSGATELLGQAEAEIGDAIRVLEQGSLHRDAIPVLREARRFARFARRSAGFDRPFWVTLAVARLDVARSFLVD